MCAHMYVLCTCMGVYDSVCTVCPCLSIYLVCVHVWCVRDVFMYMCVPCVQVCTCALCCMSVQMCVSCVYAYVSKHVYRAVAAYVGSMLCLDWCCMGQGGMFSTCTMVRRPQTGPWCHLGTWLQSLRGGAYGSHSPS